MSFKITVIGIPLLIFGMSQVVAQNIFPVNGNSGLGTTNPEAPLHIFLNSGSKPDGIVSPSQSVMKFSRFGTPNYSYNESAEFKITHGGPSVWGSRLDLYVNGAANQNNVPDQHAMTWQYNGDVGIGTTLPRSALDVSTKINEGKLGVVLGRLVEGDGEGEGTFLGIRGYHTQMSIYGGKSFGLEHSFYGVTNSSINFLRGGSQTGGCITFNTNTNIEQMRLDVNGNLLIGKTSQANSAYKLDINGKARANELVVNTTGADFVFESDYNLVSLPELEAFVKRYKHLPEIPTAKTMQEEGMGISELQTKLLQKVEELTLYLIEKDKQLELQKAINKKNEERLDKLEMLLK